MAYALKSTGLATDLVVCLLVDEDGTTIVDLCGNAVTVDAEVSVGTGSWKGTTRKYLATTNTNSTTPKRVTWNTPPTVDTVDADGMAVFIAAHGASAGTGGNTAWQTFVSFDSSSEGNGYHLARDTATGGANIKGGGGSGVTGLTAIPTTDTKFSIGANHKANVSAEVFYGLESGALASDVTASNPGNYGSAGSKVRSIGGVTGGGTQPYKPYLVAVFKRNLTLAEFQSLHGNGTDNWFSVLIEAASSPTRLATPSSQLSLPRSALAAASSHSFRRFG